MIPAVGIEQDCADCLTVPGRLCERHARDVCPQLARNIGWLKLMGEAVVEQKGRQTDDTPEGSALAQAHAARKQAARRPKGKRRGIRALAQAILAA